ncbi:MAG TPA: hypothetical protein VFS70_19140, partial [Actinomycetota bacterium]|nr:hypothetical protein [Actinomycetota bacterium]
MTSLQHDYTGAPIWEHRGVPRGASVYQGPTGATDPQSSSARTIAAKFAGKCPLCKGAIEAGDQVRWEPGRKAVHLECPVNEPAPAPAPEVEPAPEPEVEPADENLQPQITLARVSRDLTDEQLERAILAITDDALILAVLDAELDARMEEAVASSAPAAAPVVAQEPRQPARLGLDEVGVYVLPDGAVVKVQANREKTKVYAKRWTPSGQDRLMGDGHHEHGEYVYEPGLVREVEATGRKMTLEEAKAHSVRYGRCVRCGRQLTDGKSV